MKDEELLKLAEDKLTASRKAEDYSAAKEMAVESIAASLLVIARNSVPDRTTMTHQPIKLDTSAAAARSATEN